MADLLDGPLLPGLAAALKRPTAPVAAVPRAGAARPADPLDGPLLPGLAAALKPQPAALAAAPPARPRPRPQQGGGIGGWFRGVAGSVARGVSGAEDWFAGKQRSQPGFHLNPIDVGAQAAVDIGASLARARRHPHPKAVQAGVQESWRDVGQHAIGAAQKGGAILGQALNDTFRIPAEPMQPVMTALQAGTEAAAKKKIAQHGRETPGEYFKEFGKGVFNKETGKKALHSLVERDIVNWSPMSTPGAPDLPLKRGSTADKVTRFGIDLLANMLVDHQVGSRFGKGLRAGVGGGLKRAEQAGLMDLKIPKYGKSLREIQAGLDAEKAAQRHFGAARGAVAPIERQAVKAVEGARAANQRVVDLGVNLHGQGLAGQPVNLFDEMITHLREAGGKGAAFPSRAAARQWVKSQAADPAQARALYREVRRTATNYMQTWRALGSHLEAVGYLKPGTVKALGRTYMPRMYHAVSQHAPDIEEWLLDLQQRGVLTPQGEAAARRAEERLGTLRGEAAAAAHARPRVLETWQQRVEHGAETQATPLFQRGVRKQARAAEVSGGLQNIARDRTLSRPGLDPVTGTKFQPAKDEFLLKGEHFGPLEGMRVKKSAVRVVHDFIHPRQDGPVEQFMHRWGQFFQRAHTVANPPVIGHHWRYASFVGAVKSAEQKLGFLDQAAARKAIEIARWQHGGGKMTAAMQALDRNTRTFTPGRRTFLEGAGQSLRETALPPGGTGRVGRVIQGTKRAVNEGVGDIIAHIEQSYKVALTEKLAPKYGWDKAAHLANEQIGDWSQTPRPVRLLQKYGVTPFAAPRLRSVPAVVQASFYHPDLALRRSGARVPVLAARAAGPEAQARQEIEPGSIAIPGLKDAQGRQKFVSRNPIQITPARDIGALGSGLMAPLAVPLEVAGNVDFGASYRRQQATPISPSGTPPEQDVLNRVGFVAKQFMPAPVRAALGLQAASEGLAGGRGRSAPPLSAVEVGLGFLSGMEFSTPETAREKANRGRASQAGNKADQEFARKREAALQSGRLKPPEYPLAQGTLGTTTQVKSAILDGRKLYKSILTGHNLSKDERRARLAKQQNYLFQLKKLYDTLAAQERGWDARLGTRQ